MVLKLTGHIDNVFRGWTLTLVLILVKLDIEQIKTEAWNCIKYQSMSLQYREREKKKNKKKQPIHEFPKVRVPLSTYDGNL